MAEKQEQKVPVVEVHCHCRPPKKIMGCDMGYFYIVKLHPRQNCPGVLEGQCEYCERHWIIREGNQEVLTQEHVAAFQDKLKTAWNHLNIDDFSKRLGLVSDTGYREEMWERFQKMTGILQLDTLMMSKLLGIAPGIGIASQEEK